MGNSNTSQLTCAVWTLDWGTWHTSNTTETTIETQPVNL